MEQTELLKIFKNRIVTQDRDGRLPMRVIVKYLSKCSTWKNELENYVLKTRFITSDKGDKYYCLNEITELKFENNEGVVIVLKNGEQYQVYTEVFSRQTALTGKKEYKLMRAKQIKELTLDHSIPVYCIMEAGIVPTLEKINLAYSNFVVENEDENRNKEPYKLASDFYKKHENSFTEEATIKDIKILFGIGQLTIMLAKYNTAKKNNFIYCSEHSKCEKSYLKQMIDTIKLDKD